MGLIIGNRQLQGSPMAPYAQDQVYAGRDSYLPFVFLDRAKVPVVPTSITIELDDITNSINMANGPTTLSAAGSAAAPYIYPVFSSGGQGNPWMLQIAASVMQMTYPYEGSQICTLKVLWTGIDSVLGNPFSEVGVYVFELVAAPTVSGSF